MNTDRQNFFNSVSVNYVLLSLTNIFGVPKRLKSSFNTFSVFADVGCLYLNMAGHLEKLSTIIRL